MEFVFKPLDKTDFSSLFQGDILKKSDALSAALSQAHGYYANAADYTHFMVLTQSCDLVRRRPGKPPKAPYITIAAIRPFSIVVNRIVDKHKYNNEKLNAVPVKVCTKNSEVLARQNIERFLNNTEDGYFFLKGGAHPAIQEDMCTFLRLSVALRVDHYDVLLQSKAAELDGVFQAKLGWLVGNIYSRVGTPDIYERMQNPEQYRDNFVEEKIFSDAAWLSGEQQKAFIRAVDKWLDDNPGQDLSAADARRILESVPSDVTILATRISDMLVKRSVIADDDNIKEKIMNIISNDSIVKKYVK